MKTMQFTSNIPCLSKDPDCPAEFSWCFYGTWQSSFLSFQDATHMAVKAIRSLLTRELKFGSSIASKAVLLALIRQTSKAVLRITEDEISTNKDRMNYDIAEKACHPRVTQELKRPEEQATKEFLFLIQHIINAYIDPSKTIKERFYSAWYLVFFCRMWKLFLECGIKYSDSRPDAFKAILQKKFITYNLHSCIEINAHNLLIFHNQMRSSNNPNLFLPTLLNSQHCEKTFRSLRSMSTTKSTVVSFNIKEILQKAQRLKILEETQTTTENFAFNEKKNKTNISSQMNS